MRTFALIAAIAAIEVSAVLVPEDGLSETATMFAQVSSHLKEPELAQTSDKPLGYFSGDEYKWLGASEKLD